MSDFDSAIKITKDGEDYFFISEEQAEPHNFFRSGWYHKRKIWKKKEGYLFFGLSDIEVKELGLVDTSLYRNFGEVQEH